MHLSRFPLQLVFLAALLSLPHALFTELVHVQVFDQSFRPVEGAAVYANYQLNAVTGYVDSKPKFTNSSGYADVLITNYEEIAGDTDYSYTVYVKYGTFSNATGVIADGNATLYTRSVTLIVPSVWLYVYVKDQNGQGIPALVTINDQSKRADATGQAAFQLPPGNYTVAAENNGALSTARVTGLDSDRALPMEIGLYPLKVRVMNDQKQPLSATVDVDNLEQNTDANGTASFTNITSYQPQVVVKYGDTFRRFTPNLKLQSSLDAVFDVTPPVIEELHASVSSSGVGTISLFAEDPGPLASGVDTVSVSYMVGGVENTVPAYTIGYNSFEAKIPAQSPQTLVKYTVRVSDKEGNTVSEEGNYVVPLGESGPGPSTPGNESQQQPGPVPSNLPVETIFVAILVVAIIGFALVYYFTRMRRAGPPRMGEPPVQPPAEPQQPPHMPS
jgi:hypothetical protein